MLYNHIKIVIGWDQNPLVWHVVSCRKLRDEVLHIFLCVVQCCMKDNGEEHFEFVHQTVSPKDKNDGKLEYARLERWI